MKQTYYVHWDNGETITALEVEADEAIEAVLATKKKAPEGSILNSVIGATDQREYYRGKEHWTSSISNNFRNGDLVKNYIKEHFIEVLPPRYFATNLIQMGEPYSFDPETGKDTWQTIQCYADIYWVYRGCCLAGTTEAKGSQYYGEVD